MPCSPAEPASVRVFDAAQTADDLSFLRDFSVYGLHNPVDVVKNVDVPGLNLLFTAVIVALFVGAVAVFRRKRLPL